MAATPAREGDRRQRPAGAGALAPEHRPLATRLATAGALLVPLAVLGRQGGWLLLPVTLQALLLGLGVWRGRGLRAALPVRLAAQILALVACVGGLLLVPGPRLAFGLYAAAGSLGLACMRVLFRGDRRGLGITLSLGLLAWLSLSRTTGAAAYGAGSVAHLSLGVLALLLSDPAWGSRLSAHPRGVLAPLGAGLGLAAAVLVGLSWGLYRAEPAVTEALAPWVLGGPGRSVAGFSASDIELGGLSDLLVSDTVVLRVWGPPSDHLRGQVYQTYSGRRWIAPLEQRGRPRGALHQRDGALQLGVGHTQGTLRVEADGDSGGHLFAPLEALTLLNAPQEATLDPYGVLRLPPEVSSERRSYTLELGDARSTRTLRPPGPADLQLPSRYAESLREIAARWTAGAGTPAQRVERLLAQLRGTEFSYSLSLPEVPPRVDPVLHFLTTTRRGHCEYFASAFTLLARAAGVPARLVGGFRVFERNGVGGYWVVRGRDAHAWAEVHIAGRWVNADPTPAGALGEEARAGGSWLGQRWDLARLTLGRVWHRLSNLSAAEILLSLLASALLLLLWVWVRGRRRLRRTALAAVSSPLLGRLQEHLARRGGPRRPGHETLASFARRLSQADMLRAAALVDALARLQYGGYGDEAALAAKIDAYLGHGERDGPRARGGEPDDMLA